MTLRLHPEPASKNSAEGFSLSLSRVCVCLSVCLSVPALAALAYVCTCNLRYSWVSRKLYLDFDSWIFEKKLPFGSYGVKKTICK